MFLDNFIQSINSIRANKKVVLINGNFNILHHGHIRYINFASMCGDILVVAVNPDTHSGVFVEQESRLNSIRALKKVDFSIVVSDDYLSFLNKLKPEIIVKGNEYADIINIEEKYIKSNNNNNCKIIFSSGDSDGSFYNDITLKYENKYEDKEYLKRNNILKKDIKNIINNFVSKKVIIIGDVIVDEYVECEAVGMSQEDPTIVVKPISQKMFIGGAGIVAHHIESLGAKCYFFTVTGQDELSNFVASGMSTININNTIINDESRLTVHKKRYRVAGKTMIRINEYRNHDISHLIADSIFSSIRDIISDVDMLIFSDFNYGCLPQYLVDKLTELCTNYDVPIFADSQSSSQSGDSSRFLNTNLLSVTEREARLALHDLSSGLVVLAEKLCIKSNAKNCILKMGANGILIHIGNNYNNINKVTDIIPALNNESIDVAGAGDSLLAATCLALISGANIWEAAYIGSVMAAIQVSNIGNIPISRDQLMKKLF